MYLQALNIAVPCLLHPDRPAKLDPAFRTQVNYEVFFFSDTGSRRKFEKNPTEYSGLLTDPVTQKRFQPQKSSPRWTYHERRYFFSSDSTLQLFKAAPDSFALRKGM